MKKLSFDQLNRSSEIIGNISVAWFSGGVIAPIISHSFKLIEFITFIVVSLIMSGIFFNISLEIIKKKNKI